MKYAIDETELVRLEALAGKASKGPFFEDGVDVQDDDDNEVACCNRSDDLDEDTQEANAQYIAAACNNVPALIAEIRRLRAENISLREDVYALSESWDYEYEANQRHEHMVAELMEKVEAWEWFGECRSLILWRGPEDEMMGIFNAAREAVNVDRE